MAQPGGYFRRLIYELTIIRLEIRAKHKRDRLVGPSRTAVGLTGQLRYEFKLLLIKNEIFILKENIKNLKFDEKTVKNPIILGISENPMLHRKTLKMRFRDGIIDHDLTSRARARAIAILGN